MNKFKLLELIFFVLTLLCAIVVGWLGNDAYESMKNERILNGLHIQDVTYEQVNAYADWRDEKGDWVCVNIAFDMTPEEALQTCNHEVMHQVYSEIWAELCEDNFEKCTNDLSEIQRGIKK